MKKITFFIIGLILPLSSNFISAQTTSSSQKPLYGETIKHGTFNRSNDRLANKGLALPEELTEENGWKEITPQYFRFNTAFGDKYTDESQRQQTADIINQLISTNATANLDGFKGNPIDNWIKNTAERDFPGEKDKLSKGMIFLSGGSLHSHYKADVNAKHEDQRQIFKSGVTSLDFGDEVGNVMLFNGIKSNLADTLALGYYKDNFTVSNAADWILFNSDVDNPENDGAKKDDYTLIFLPIDPNTYAEIIRENDENEDSESTFTIRVLYEFNTYRWKDAWGAVADINGILDNYGQTVRTDGANGPNYNVTINDTYYQNCWDATKWMLYEIDIELKKEYFSPESSATGIQMIDGVPCVRVQYPAQNLNYLAYFIRNVRMFIKKGSDDEFSKDSPVRITPQTYLLRPNEVYVKTKKLFVNEPNFLEGFTMPMWATRDVRWVLVDNEGNQYRTLSDPEIPTEITDRISSFDEITGAIVPKSNGHIYVQAISCAEGVGPEGEKVEKVMSAVTSLPIYNVVHKIDINHEHHLVDKSNDKENTIQLSGNESTRVEYELRTSDDLSLSEGIAKFDPETPLQIVFTGTSEADFAVNNSSDGTFLHGDNYMNYISSQNRRMPLLYNGKGAFDLTVSPTASLNLNSGIELSVLDGREEWDLYLNDPRFSEGQRNGFSHFHHYAEPKNFRYSHDYTYREIQEIIPHYLVISNEMPSGVDKYMVDINVLNQTNEKDVAFQKWEIKDIKDPLSSIEIKTDEEGHLILKPLQPNRDGIWVTLKAFYAGTYKSSLASEMQNENFLSPSYNIEAFSPENIVTINDELNPFVYYDAEWESGWKGQDNVSHSAPVYEKNLRIDIYDEIHTYIDSLPTSSDDIEEFFTLEGLRINKPTEPGVYISRLRNVVKKIIIR